MFMTEQDKREYFTESWQIFLRGWKRTYAGNWIRQWIDQRVILFRRGERWAWLLIEIGNGGRKQFSDQSYETLKACREAVGEYLGVGRID